MDSVIHTNSGFSLAEKPASSNAKVFEENEDGDASEPSSMGQKIIER